MESVDIIMSIYNPDENFFIEQLKSLNNQDYENINIIIYNDYPKAKINKELILKYITKYPVTFYENERNLGYIKAFEFLTTKTTADYVAFCDQDDVWHSNKISKSVETLKKDNTLVVASERTIIDENGNITKKLAREGSNKNYDNWHSFDDITKYTAIICFAVGMSMVTDGKFLRSILPFPKQAGHDQWALMCAGVEGNISFIEEPLVDYRRHSHNVSGVLLGINTKEEYVEQRVIPNIELIEIFKKKYPNQKDIKDLEAFTQARKSHNIFTLMKYYSFAPDVAKFDMVISLVPNFLFKPFLSIIRKL